jgi:hypothetical protein
VLLLLLAQPAFEGEHCAVHQPGVDSVPVQSPDVHCASEVQASPTPRPEQNDVLAQTG